MLPTPALKALKKGLPVTCTLVAVVGLGFDWVAVPAEAVEAVCPWLVAVDALDACCPVDALEACRPEPRPAEGPALPKEAAPAEEPALPKDVALPELTPAEGTALLKGVALF